MKPVVFGCSGHDLTASEREFFAEAKPFGFILFQRNCATPDQTRRLVADLRACSGNPETPVFIDQEGGRVARLKPPHWPALPPLRAVGALYESDPRAGEEAMALHSLATAAILRDLGINGNCAPVLDLHIAEASSAIGDRALSRDPCVVQALGVIAVETYLASGVFPVIKHMPGHGRARVDPHESLPVDETGADELEKEDFVPFKALHDAPFGMSCHVVFKALDPDNPISLSAAAHRAIFRGALGFEGLIMSDDLAMQALTGPMESRALKALEAGADLALYCPGDLDSMRAIAAVVPDMGPDAALRWEKAKSRLARPFRFPPLGDALERLESLISYVSL